MTTPKALLIAIEGIDGSGKTTQAAALSASISSEVSVKSARVRAFGARSIYRLAEQLTGDPLAYHPAIPAFLREFTFACDVAQYAHVEISPALAAGDTVIWDRGPLSYRAFARAYDGLSDWVTNVQALFPRPHLTVLLDLPADIAIARLRERRQQPHQTDESEPLLQKAREMLLDEAGSRSDVLVLEAARPPADLTDAIAAAWRASSPNPT